MPIVEALVSIFTWSHIVVGFVGGMIAGVMYPLLMYNTRLDAVETARAMFISASFVGLIFFTGQFFASLGTDGDDFAWRVFARFLIWIVFTAGLSVGASSYTRYRQGRWREHRHGIRRGLN